MIYARLLRPLLFRLEPEAAHQLTLQLLARTSATALGRSALRRKFHYHDAALRVSVFGIDFQNPVGTPCCDPRHGLIDLFMHRLGWQRLPAVTVVPTRNVEGGIEPRCVDLFVDHVIVNLLPLGNSVLLPRFSGLAL